MNFQINVYIKYFICKYPYVCLVKPAMLLFCTVIGDQFLKSQSADNFLNMDMDSGVPSAPRSHSWMGSIGTNQREMDTASSHSPHTQDAFLSPLLNKGWWTFSDTIIFCSVHKQGQDR